MLAEDDDFIRNAMAYLYPWTAWQCQICASAENGRQGIELIRREKPDIVITDVRMPLVDGIRMLEETCDMDYEAIVVSAYDEFSYAKDAMRRGVQDYVLKPIEEDELADAVTRCIERIEEKRRLRAVAERNEEHDGSGFPLPERQVNYHVRKALTFIEDHFAEKMMLSDVCDALGISATHLNDLLKEHTGHTFNDLLMRYRIHRAIRLINSTHHKIYEISAMVGIPDYQYFSTVFKKLTGCSPREYSKRSEELGKSRESD